MATASSGAFETSVYDAAGSAYPNRIRIEWSSSQSVANNTSTIYWTVKSAGGTGNSYSYVMAGPVTVNIAGVTVFSRSDRFEMHVGETLGSGSFTLTHNTDGTKSFSAWAEAAIYTYAVSSTRYGYSVDLPQIPRKSTVTASNATLGNTVSININRASSSFTHTIRWAFGNKSSTIATKTSNTSVLFPTYVDLALEIPNSTTGTCTIYCDTYSGDTLVGTTTYNITLTVPSNIIPTIRSFTSSIASTNPPGCGLYVKNNSTVKWTVSVSGAKGSTIKKCVISGPNLSYETNSSSNSYSATSSTLTTFGEKTYTVTVTDSRGRSASMTKNITVVDYNSPLITSYTSFRSNSNGSMNSSGTYITHKITPSFYPLNDGYIAKNIAKIVVYSKKGSDLVYGNAATITNSAENQKALMFTYTDQTFAIDSTYDFKIVISDSVGQSATVYTHVGTKNVPINIASNNNSIAIGCFAQASNTGRFDCAWEAHFATAPITDSDRNLKHNIKDINIDVIDKLRPVQYNLINDESDTTHYGFIAQDVEQALLESGVTSDKMGIVHYDENYETQERTNYALSYDEIIPLLVKKCQELQREIDKLKGE